MLLEWIIVIFLIVFGLGLIVAEVIFVPGTTLVGILGFLLTASGVYMGFINFGDNTGMWLLGLSLLGGVGAIVYGIRSDTWTRFSLNSTSEGRVNDEFINQLSVGAIGKAVSELRPQGKVLFQEQIYEVRTFGQYLESGTEVRIAKVASHTIYVEPLSIYK
jgi:membrane-bound ClpP family serine protease